MSHWVWLSWAPKLEGPTCVSPYFGMISQTISHFHIWDYAVIEFLGVTGCLARVFIVFLLILEWSHICTLSHMVVHFRKCTVLRGFVCYIVFGSGVFEEPKLEFAPFYFLPHSQVGSATPKPEGPTFIRLPVFEWPKRLCAHLRMPGQERDKCSITDGNIFVRLVELFLPVTP